MSVTRTEPGGRHRRWAPLALLPLLAAGCGGGLDPVGSAAPPPTVSATPFETPVQIPEVRAAGLGRVVAAAARRDVARPTRILLPRLGINAAMDPLRLNKKRVLIPPKYGRAGWYKKGPEPGEAGRAVVAGHVDSKTGPDVFAALNRARKGDRILFRLADGSTVRFAVVRVERHAQTKFPSRRVYGGSQRHAKLRLITCTGAYDRSRGRYLDNLIVFATLIR